MTDMNSYPQRGHVRAAVSEWLSQAPEGVEFHLNDITADLGLELSSISGVLRSMARNNEGVTVMPRRGWYRKDTVPARVPVVPAPAQAPVPARAYAPEPAQQDKELKSGDLMEVVAVFKSGRVLLRAAANNQLYTAEEAEL